MPDAADFRLYAKKIAKTIIDNRRHLHAHPELSFEEYQTSVFIKNRLDELGIKWKSMAGTGVVALIKGKMKSGRVVALRADMDALPISEHNEASYCSKNNGVMHACGHDVHTASLLGAAQILRAMQDQFGGTVKLIFQPGEEKLPGGASIMIREGVLKDPVPDAVIGQHVTPLLEAGKIGMRKGIFMASMDEITGYVYGRGGHGAQPHQNIDPVMITAQILVSLQQIVSRMANPGIPTVLSFGKLLANGAINIIPDHVYLEGTFRTYDDQWRMNAHRHIKKVASSIAEGMGGKCDLQIRKGYPALINNEQLTSDLAGFAETYLGKKNVIENEIWMAAEDFAYYSQLSPACFYLLGVAKKGQVPGPSLHTPDFDIDENALVTGCGLMSWLAYRNLGNE
ncbi:MAG TPA: M20 family metallopeptidase [Puia sp.]|nr:M20 family metallopeptidase [Puia sp.]